MAIIKAIDLLAPNWEKCITYNDYLLWKSYSNQSSKFYKVRKKIVVTDYYMSTAESLAESGIIYYSSSIDFLYGIVLFGLVQICLTNNIEVDTIQAIKANIKQPNTRDSEDRVFDLIRKTKKDERLANLLNLYSSNKISRDAYKIYFNRELTPSEPFKPNLYFVDDIIKYTPNTSCFDINKERESKNFSPYIHKEIVNLAYEVKVNLYLEQKLSSIFRASFIQGLYSLCHLIKSTQLPSNDYECNLLIRKLEKLVLLQL